MVLLTDRYGGDGVEKNNMTVWVGGNKKVLGETNV